MLAEIQPGVVLANLADCASRSMSTSCPPSGTVKTLICVMIPVFVFITGIAQFLLGLGGTTATDERLRIFGPRRVKPSTLSRRLLAAGSPMSAKRSFPKGKGSGLPDADPGPF